MLPAKITRAPSRMTVVPKGFCSGRSVVSSRTRRKPKTRSAFSRAARRASGAGASPLRRASRPAISRRAQSKLADAREAWPRVPRSLSNAGWRIVPATRSRMANGIRPRTTGWATAFHTLPEKARTCSSGRLAKLAWIRNSSTSLNACRTAAILDRQKKTRSFRPGPIPNLFSEIRSRAGSGRGRPTGSCPGQRERP